MTPVPTAHLQALLSLLLLLLLAGGAPSASAATLAVSAGSAVCAVASDNGTLYCAVPALPNATATANASAVAPSLVFSRVSGGARFLCALATARGSGGGGGGDSALLCWPPSDPASLRRVYWGTATLADLAVGDTHVAAYDRQARRIRWWRRGSGSGQSQFPEPVLGAFRSIVSGDGFTCALETTNSSGSKVRCWGPQGSAVEAAFANATSVSSLAAGGARACGVEDGSGAVLCSGSGAGALAQTGLYPNGLAVGDSHACGLLRPNHTAVCWSLAGPTPTVYYPAYGTPFEFLVAGGNLTCGLVSTNFTVECWSSSSADNAAVEVPLPPVLPGACVPDESSCVCGLVQRSAELCAGSGGGVICKRLCEVSPPPPPPTASPPQSPPGTASKGVSKGWIAFAVVGAVGAFIGLCSIVYCFVFGFCSHKRIHNSVQPNLPGAGNNNAAAAADTNAGVVASPYSSPNGSRARGGGGLFLRRQLSRAMTRQRSGPSSFKDPTEEYTFAQLSAATGGFAAEAKIGEGSFGAVYRGKLPDGREVAIKRAGESPRRFQEKESAFRSELAFLSRLHHKHLVSLVGYCEENDERLLVYEYMKNGALYDHLHPEPDYYEPSSSPSPVVSSWKLRIKILLDASRGIDYLHSYAVPPIIHRDIKSSNILLDGSWVARVSDFGLSLMGPPETDEATAAAAPLQQHYMSSMKAAGTVGYMDPEYYGLHHLTVKSDVYGFGVVMLEALTGKRAIFKDTDGDGGPVSVVDYAQPSIVSGELGKVLDGRAPEPAPHEAEAVELVAYTAVYCVRLEGKDRPAMADIVANLETAFALCEGSAGGGRGNGAGGGGFGNSSSSASLSLTSMELSGRRED